MTARPKLLFWVQHLLGIGHLRRAETLSHHLLQAGFEVTLVSGGMALPHRRVPDDAFVQLPPARATDIYFKLLVDERDQAIDDGWRAGRRDLLLDLFRRQQPDIVMTELFPFGRRQFRFELLPLLDAALAARPRPLITSSVRDILVQPAKPERRHEMIDLVKRYVDLVLVHGDPSLVGFEETFPEMGEIAERLCYTGYVLESQGGQLASEARREVLVSAGGGAVSEPLLRAALAARPLSALKEVPWRLLVGFNLADTVLADLQRQAPSGVTVERARPDFPRLLGGARLSISQAGYNTVMEVLDAGTRAVVVPYAGGLETEQTLRSERLAQRGALQVVAESELTPAAIAAAVDRALAQPPASHTGLDMGGAEATGRLLRQALDRRRQPLSVETSTRE
jgi:predicted glycosyltransferase